MGKEAKGGLEERGDEEERCKDARGGESEEEEGAAWRKHLENVTESGMSVENSQKKTLDD